MKVAEVSRKRDGCLEVDVSVSPRSGKSGLDGFDQWRKRMIVRVKAPPLEGRANKEVEDLFRSITGMRSQVVSGQTSRQKTVAVYGDPGRAEEALDHAAARYLRGEAGTDQESGGRPQRAQGIRHTGGGPQGRDRAEERGSGRRIHSRTEFRRADQGVGIRQRNRKNSCDHDRLGSARESAGRIPGNQSRGFRRQIRHQAEDRTGFRVQSLR
ncbi:MAG: YggU family protein [Candidatus Methanomethylophilaceae archaeon]|nr:YggU family protein [Candidatus Methanomethylophilaceae archaeon]